MEFLKNHWEKLILALALLGLMASAVLVGMRIGHGQLETTIPNPPKRQPPPLDQEALGALVDHASKPPVWKGGSAPLFGSVARWWDKDQKSARWFMATGERKIIDDLSLGKVPRQWLKDNGLDYKDPEIDDKDSDNDGWTNAEEYRFKTKPMDAESHPVITDYLFLERTVRKDFILLFKGYSRGPDNTVTFQINVRDDRFTYFNKLGEQVASGDRKENYRVESFEPKTEPVYDPTLNHTNNVDVSVLVISRLEDGSKISLVKGKTATESTLGAVLINKLLGRPFPVAKEEEIKIRGETYKVVDIKNDRVLISDSLKREFWITAPKNGE